MSKYIKLEDIKMLINACEWRMTLAKERHGEGFVDYDKQVLDVDELTKRLTDLPTIEVSEDCISREYMLEKAQEWKNMYPDSDTAREALTMLMNEIDNAPSVVPKERKEE